MVEYLDEITGEYYKNCGFDAMDGAYRRAYREFLAPCIPPRAAPMWKAATRAARSAFSSTRLDKPQRPSGGHCGEFLHRDGRPSPTWSWRRSWRTWGGGPPLDERHQPVFAVRQRAEELRVKIRDLCQYDMGPPPPPTSGTQGVRRAGFDGLVHVKSAPLHSGDRRDARPPEHRGGLQDPGALPHLRRQTSDVA